MSYADLDGNGKIESGSEILEENNYYPFGLQHDGYNMGVKPQRSVEAEQYTFLDKEFEDNFGLNVTETDFRHYDSALGRFNVMDPMAELAYDFTPYRYGFNNPVFFSDASGLFETAEQAQAYAISKGFSSFNSKVVENEKLGGYTLVITAGLFKGAEFYNFKLIKNPDFMASSGGGGGGSKGGNNSKSKDVCQNCIDPSTIGKNIFNLTYPGGDNPKSYNGEYSYSYIPLNLAEYPAIGHDRRYDNLKIEGAKGLLFDTKAIGADWRFVAEELSIAISPATKFSDKAAAASLGVGLGLATTPKTIYQLSQPFGITKIIIWYRVSNTGVNNSPTPHKH